MNLVRNGWMMMVALLAFACGQGRSGSPPPTVVVEVPPADNGDGNGSTLPETPPPPSWVDLRIHGFGAGAYRATLVGVNDVLVAVDGADASATVAPKTVDLADPFTTYPLARFQVPSGARKIKVTLLLDAWGGYERTVGAVTDGGTIDARGTPICLEVDAEPFVRAGSIVVHVDVGASLVERAGALLLLPEVIVREYGLHQLRTLRVDDDRVECPAAGYASIQEAVNAARAGEAIEVCPGVYAEHVVVDRPLYLEGSGPAPVDRNGDPLQEAVVLGQLSLWADHVVVAGFTVIEGDFGVFTAPGASGYVVRDNFIAVHLAGVVVTSDGQKTSWVKRNRIVANTLGVLAIDDCVSDGSRPPLAVTPGDYQGALQALVGAYEADAGSWLAGEVPDGQADPEVAPITVSVTSPPPAHRQHGRFLVLSQNLIRDNDLGVLIATARDTLVSENEIRTSLIGVLDVAGAANEYAGNQVHENDLGMWFIASRELGVTRNDASLNGEFGIGLLGTQLSLLVGNVSDGNLGDGIALEASWSNVVRENRAWSNGADGIWATAESFGNFFEGNSLHQNVHHDAHDDLREDNIWLRTDCGTDSVDGAICAP